VQGAQGGGLDVPLTLDRRRFLQLGLAVPAGVALAACADDGGGESTASSASSATTTTSDGTTPTTALTPTPACGADDEPTIEQTEGPFFSSGSPERTSLVDDGIDGTRLVVTGAVVDTACAPIPGTKLDFWQTDDAGEYDNDGFRLRGHQFADAGGGYRLETIVPGRYPGRTRHIHVKVQPANGDVLTTQLYFPDEQDANEGDGIFDESLLMAIADGTDSQTATFDFVLEP
jgi:protocatechuate 3,4-dioxygenase beta subunit